MAFFCSHNRASVVHTFGWAKAMTIIIIITTRPGVQFLSYRHVIIFTVEITCFFNLKTVQTHSFPVISLIFSMISFVNIVFYRHLPAFGCPRNVSIEYPILFSFRLMLSLKHYNASRKHAVWTYAFYFIFMGKKV